MGNGKTVQLEVRLREATAQDRSRLVALINAAYSIEDFMEGTRIDERGLAATMAKGEILMAEDAEGRLLGSVYVDLRGRRGYLGLLAVDPAAQGRGLGRMLTEAAEERMRAAGCEAADIVVLSPRTELPPMYRRFGYEVTGIEEFKPVRKVKEGVEVRGVMMSKRL